MLLSHGEVDNGRMPLCPVLSRVKMRLEWVCGVVHYTGTSESPTLLPYPPILHCTYPQLGDDWHSGLTSRCMNASLLLQVLDRLSTADQISLSLTCKAFFSIIAPRLGFGTCGTHPPSPSCHVSHRVVVDPAQRHAVESALFRVEVLCAPLSRLKMSSLGPSPSVYATPLVHVDIGGVDVDVSTLSGWCAPYLEHLEVGCLSMHKTPMLEGGRSRSLLDISCPRMHTLCLRSIVPFLPPRAIALCLCTFLSLRTLHLSVDPSMSTVGDSYRLSLLSQAPGVYTGLTALRLHSVGSPGPFLSLVCSLLPSLPSLRQLVLLSNCIPASQCLSFLRRAPPVPLVLLTLSGVEGRVHELAAVLASVSCDSEQGQASQLATSLRHLFVYGQVTPSLSQTEGASVPLGMHPSVHGHPLNTAHTPVTESGSGHKSPRPVVGSVCPGLSVLETPAVYALRGRLSGCVQVVTADQSRLMRLRLEI
ncbi:hypothetical protein KIPB_008827 [Kipferlia bialata]|uniref:F-box domain-containing protein n=1 Tax=Kipferlia bialata TaxID=797122 RepID=A0A9K3GK63_9EUKA|nr:hypothetical protein KIPB_008827 [Kipferlia bialata]|eukprot:g8827.t1